MSQTDSRASLAPNPYQVEECLIQYEQEIRGLIKIQAELRVHIDLMYEKMEEKELDNKLMNQKNENLTKQKLNVINENSKHLSSIKKYYNLYKDNKN